MLLKPEPVSDAPPSRRVWNPGNAPKATIDFETRSACPIKECGSWRYSLDETTEALCLVYRLPHWEEGRTEAWWPDFPEHGIVGTRDPEDLFAWILSGGLVEAHNAWFERGIWKNVMSRRLGWPPIRHEQWRCSAAKAAAYSLPRSLEGCAEALRLLVRKDMDGAKVMKKLAKPKKPKIGDARVHLARIGVTVPKKGGVAIVKSDAPGRYEAVVDGGGSYELPICWTFDAPSHARLVAYCRLDVLAEEAVSDRLRDLSPLETRMYLMDQAINERGFQIDREAVEAALAIVDDLFKDMNRELFELTDGTVEKATQRERVKAWLADQGVILSDTQGPTIDRWLGRQDLPVRARRGLQLVRALGRTSTAKYVAAQNWVDPATWRVHGGLLYHGAGTGRWSGAGVQPHNFPRGNIKDMDLAWQVLKTRDVALIEALYGDVMECLSYALRGMIIPTPGRKLVVADYAAIEARVIFWLADDQDALDIFRRGDCIYCDMASDIYKRPIIKGVDLDERQMGKQAVLGLGYGMGAPKFRDTCAKYGMVVEDGFSQYVINTYREKYWRIKQMWYDQEAAAIEAVRRPGQTIRCGRVQWRFFDEFLHCRLPSGRLLGYPFPAIVKRPTPWGALKDALSYMTVDGLTRKWRRIETYGGMIVENITQAVARDLMAHSMLECTDEGVYDVILSVHDELLTETDPDVGDYRGCEARMSSTPDWAEGCPVTAEGWEGYRYKK